jgi:hypothetical protein
MCKDVSPDVRVEVLQREFDRVQAKSSATDSAFMSYLSVGVTPFLVFTAYAVAERKYQIFLGALPVLTVLGLSVVVVLSTHYSFAAAYSEYLEERINTLLGTREMRDSDFARQAYKVRSSPVILSWIIALVTLVALNLVAVPAINKFRARFPSEHIHAPCSLKAAVHFYWWGVGPFVAISSLLLMYSAFRTHRKLRCTSKAARSCPNLSDIDVDDRLGRC